MTAADKSMQMTGIYGAERFISGRRPGIADYEWDATDKPARYGSIPNAIAEVDGLPASIRADVLDLARDAVTRDRASTYGAPEDTFGKIAALWSVRLGVPVTPAQVAIMMIDLKTARAWGNPGHADNWVDMAGYAACGAELAGVVVK